MVGLAFSSARVDGEVDSRRERKLDRGVAGSSPIFSQSTDRAGFLVYSADFFC